MNSKLVTDSITQAIDHGSFSKWGSLVDAHESTPQNLCKVLHMLAVSDNVCVLGPMPHECWLARLRFFSLNLYNCWVTNGSYAK
jgi:hypothetical protein